MNRHTCTACWKPTSTYPWAARRPSWLSQPPPAATRCPSWVSLVVLLPVRSDSGLLQAVRAAPQVIEVHVNLMTCNIADGLTEDAVSARLHQGAPAAYLPGVGHTGSRMS